MQLDFKGKGKENYLNNKRLTKSMATKKRKLPRVTREVKWQRGKVKSVSKDRKVKAMRPGVRLSKRNKKYMETRKNRSDKKGKKI